MANREKSVTVPEDLFWLMAAYVLEDSVRTPENHETIVKGIKAKLDRITEHKLYTKYKTAPTEEQREEARNEYLERKGIHSSFRW